MTPQSLGFPPQFEHFRAAQEEAIEHALTSEKRFIGIGAPPGVGKSGCAYALSRLLGGRTAILTANLGLARQYMEAGFPGMVEIKGRANYPCWEGGTCEDGGRLGCGDKEGCPYLGAFRSQQESDIILTNYAYWLAVHDKAQGVRPPDTLICDEAGECHEWLSRALDFHIGEREVREAGVKLSPLPGEDTVEWSKLWQTLLPAAEGHLTRIKARTSVSVEKRLRDLRHAESFVERCEKLIRLDHDWVITREDGTDDGRLWHFECIWPGRYKEKLFRGIERVILMSATLRPKTLSLLGIKRDECDFREWPRQFPAANGPVVWVPTARMTHRMSGEDEAIWLRRIGEIFKWGSDRKGLVHTVSYLRAKQIASSINGNHGIPVFVNGAADPESSTARQVYERFMASDRGVLVSPSFSTGWDFPRQAAEWQIIAKIAFPDTRSKLMQARMERDPDYANYLAAQDLVQGSGRIVRSETDRGTSICIDDNISWFTRVASEHMPRWFKIRREEELPKPLPKL